MSFQVPEKFRLPGFGGAELGNNGAFLISIGSMQFRAIASDGEGWEHVSISLPKRCPSWPEMCKVKELFWGDDDCVLQYHPPKSDYVNCHPYCLHLWRPIGQEIPRPPVFMVGPLSN